LVLAGGLTIDTVIGGSGTLDLAAGALTGGRIVFTGIGGLLQIDGASGPSSPIGGLGRGDLIDLRAVPATAATVAFNAATGGLTVSGGGVSETVILSGVAAGATFTVAADGQGGSLVREVPGAPTGLALSPGSDSGIAGDLLTNVTV